MATTHISMAIMAITILPEPDQSPMVFPAFLQTLVPGLVALALLALSLPQLRTELSLLQAKSVMWQVGQGEIVAADKLEQASAEFRKAARAIPLNASYWEAAALSGMLASLGTGSVDDLSRIRTDIRQAAEHAPGKSSIWANVAHADFLAGDISGKTLDALRLSFLTGRLELMEISIRLRLGLIIWNDLPADLQDQVALELDHLWRGHQKQLAEIYVSLPSAAKSRMATLLPNGQASIIQFMRRKEEMDRTETR